MDGVEVVEHFSAIKEDLWRFWLSHGSYVVMGGMRLIRSL